ncbi:MAG: pilus assembly protein PilM [Candidatus Omnitrophota bacterium]
MATNKLLGINFGSDALDIVEIEKQKILSFYHAPYLETKDKAEVTEVADEIRLAAVLQKALRDKKIQTLDAIVTVPSKEILLRSFLIPVLPKNEVRAAIDFEARKYIPIKLDDLFFDYLLQKTKDKKSRKLKTHFIGIKKVALNKFLYALEQSNLITSSVETSSFSLFRLLLHKRLVKSNSNIALLDVGKQEGSICIIEGGFPELIRDFKFTSMSKDIYSQEPDTLSSHLNKEVRLSFDYYRRQSQKENVGEIFLFTDEKDSQLKDNLNKEFNIPVTTIIAKEILGLSEDVPIGILKAFGIAMRNSVSSPVTIDLLQKRKAVEVKEKIEVEVSEVAVSPKSVMRTAIMAACFVLLFYLFVDFSQLSTLKTKLKNLTQGKAAIEYKLGALTLVELQNLKTDLKGKIQILKEAGQVPYATPLLNVLPSLIPRGVWLTNISFSFDPLSSFKLEGNAYTEDETSEINFVNRFLNNLKENREFKDAFSQINLDFVRQRAIEDFEVTEFGITGR